MKVNGKSQNLDDCFTFQEIKHRKIHANDFSNT